MSEKIILEHFLELNKKYTGLSLSRNDKGESIVVGILACSMEYSGYRIDDDFELAIEIPPEYPERAPDVKEVGGRIPPQFHTHPSGKTLCLASPFDIKRKFLLHNNLIGFVETLVIPFLYSYSYYEKTGNMPFGELSHGGEGLFENYKELFNVDSVEQVLRLFKIIIDNSYKGHNLCPCGSGNILRKCHGDILREILEIHGYGAFMYEYHSMTEHLLENDDFKFPQNALPKFILKKDKSRKKKN